MIIQNSMAVDGIGEYITYIRDIEYFEGPLLTEFQSTRGNDSYIAKWCDIVDDKNIWMLFRTTKLDIVRYCGGEITQLELIRNTPDSTAYFFRSDSTDVMTDWEMFELKNLPISYYPAEDSFCMELKQEENIQNILIGEEYSKTNIGLLPRWYNNCSSFIYLFGHANRQNGLRIDYNLTRGYVYHTLFNKLTDYVPVEARAKIDRLSFASPGILRFTLKNDIRNKLLDALFVFRDKHEESSELLKGIRRELRVNDRADNTLLNSDTIALAELYNVEYGRIRDVSKDDETATRMLLSFVNRLRSLLQYEADGVAKIVGVSR